MDKQVAGACLGTLVPNGRPLFIPGGTNQTHSVTSSTSTSRARLALSLVPGRLSHRRLAVAMEEELVALALPCLFWS